MTTEMPWLGLVRIEGDQLAKSTCSRGGGRLAGDALARRGVACVTAEGFVCSDCVTSRELVRAAEQASAERVAQIQAIGRAEHQDGETVDALLARLVEEDPELVNAMAETFDVAVALFKIARRFDDDAFDLGEGSCE